jgi:hypothetical protein
VNRARRAYKASRVRRVYRACRGLRESKAFKARRESGADKDRKVCRDFLDPRVPMVRWVSGDRRVSVASRVCKASKARRVNRATTQRVLHSEAPLTETRLKPQT